MSVVLGIETSCDDTALALVQGREVIASVRIAQQEHEAFGGVVPELAARAHQRHWKQALEQLWDASGLSWEKVDLIAATQGPGLQTSLLTGTTLGSFWSLLYQKPLIGVHHIMGHILSVALDREEKEILLPSLVLTVSGGHTELHLRQENDITLLGKTLDDAAGEAFDKVAKMLGLGYPGGPEISRWAEKGDRKAFDLPRIYLKKDSLDFSFSGLKAAVRRIIEKAYPAWLDQQTTDNRQQTTTQQTFISDLCASFEEVVWVTFRKKLERALERYPEAEQVHFVGGVSANTYISNQLREWLASQGKTLLTPKRLAYCTDNAAMIAYAGQKRYQQNPSLARIQPLEPNANLSLPTIDPILHS